MKVLRQIGKRNQLTLPARLLKKAAIRSGDYVEVTEGQGKIIILPKSIEDKKLTEEEWQELEHLVKRQIQKKEFTEYRDIKGAQKHLKGLRR